MTSLQQQRKADLMRALWCGQKTLDAYQGDSVGRQDIARRLSRVSAQLFLEEGGSQAEYAEYCQNEDAKVIEADRLARERFYVRRGYNP